MPNMQSMLFMHKLIDKYSGHTLKDQLLARKDRHGKEGDSPKRFAGILPEEQLKAMSHATAGEIGGYSDHNSPLKEDLYIRNQYDKRNNLLEEVNMNNIGNNSK